MSNEMLIRCCAPTMASLKTGNMFNCPFGSREEMLSELRGLNQILGRKGLRVLPLRWSDGRALVYLYRPKMLERISGTIWPQGFFLNADMPAEIPAAALLS